MSPSWSAPLELSPIKTPDGKTLRTLGDVKDYAQTIPPEKITEQWRKAEALVREAAEEPHQLNRLRARAAVYVAIYGEPAPKPRKETWRDRRKARRPSE